MANELEFIAQTPAATHYVHVYDPAQGGAARNVTDAQWDADEDGTWSKYTVAATRVGSTSRFRASLPSGTDAAAMYDFQAFQQAGGSEADTDSPVYFATYIPGNVPANVVDMDDGVIAAATFAADVDAEFLSYLVDDATRIDASALNTATGTTIPAILDDTDLIDDGTSGLAKIATDVAAILVDTGTTLDGKINTIDGIVDDILVDTGTTLPGTLTSMSGATFDTSTDSLEALRNRGDAAWTTGTATSTLTQADVRTAVGLSSANLDTQIADLPTVAEFEARTLVAANYFDPAADTVDVDSFTTAAKAELQQEATDALNAYDPPTRTEATADKDAIVTQGNSAWATATGFSTHTAANVRTEMDANSTQLAAIVADTNELQTNQGNWLTATGFSTFDPGSDTVTVGANQDKTGYALTTAYDAYHADIKLNIDDANSQDEYTITWFKNGVRVTSGITLPTLQVIKRSDGTDLIASTTPTQIASTGSYKHDATTTARMTAGQDALAIVTATIDASSRTFATLVGRDSSA